MAVVHTAAIMTTEVGFNQRSLQCAQLYFEWHQAMQFLAGPVFLKVRRIKPVCACSTSQSGSTGCASMGYIIAFGFACQLALDEAV